jgi:hypothetical protein
MNFGGSAFFILSGSNQDEDAPSSGFRIFMRSLGPGLITGAADDDPSGIGTHSPRETHYAAGTSEESCKAFNYLGHGAQAAGCLMHSVRQYPSPLFHPSRAPIAAGEGPDQPMIEWPLQVAGGAPSRSTMSTVAGYPSLSKFKTRAALSNRPTQGRGAIVI